MSVLEFCSFITSTVTISYKASPHLRSGESLFYKQVPESIYCLCCHPRPGWQAMNNSLSDCPKMCKYWKWADLLYEQVASHLVGEATEIRRVIPAAYFTNKWTGCWSTEPHDCWHVRGIDTQNSQRIFGEGYPSYSENHKYCHSPFQSPSSRLQHGKALKCPREPSGMCSLTTYSRGFQGFGGIPVVLDLALWTQQAATIALESFLKPGFRQENTAVVEMLTFMLLIKGKIAKLNT